MNNANYVTNTQLRKFFLFTNPKNGSHVHIFSISKGVLPYMGYVGMCIPKGYGFFYLFCSAIVDLL